MTPTKPTKEHIPRRAIRQRCHVDKHDEQDQREHADKYRAAHPKVGIRRRLGRAQTGAPYGNRVVDGRGERERQDGACDEGGNKVGGEVVVDEQLAAEQEEGEVVDGPK